MKFSASNPYLLASNETLIRGVLKEIDLKNPTAAEFADIVLTEYEKYEELKYLAALARELLTKYTVLMQRSGLSGDRKTVSVLSVILFDRNFIEFCTRRVVVKDKYLTTAIPCEPYALAVGIILQRQVSTFHGLSKYMRRYGVPYPSVQHSIWRIRSFDRKPESFITAFKEAMEAE